MSGLTRNISLTLVGIVVAAVGIAQDGVSTAGAARTKYLSGMGMIPAAREVIVEDFVNYHRHEIGRPKAGEAVALDVRWNGLNPDDEAVLQVGLATSLAHDRRQLKPINLSLVIDKSGSMSAADKMSRVKTALLTMVSQLRPTDTLSIVVFDSNASVLLPGQKLGDKRRALNLIRGLQPGSATNLNAGLVLGYQEAQKTFLKGGTNRVVLLTDGIANQGVTDPKEIASGSLAYNNKGIDLSTIGVGLDLDKDLLSTLAKSGRGLYHFVADAEDVDKVFDKELQSLISPVANEPSIRVEFGPGLKLQKVYGYEPKIGKNFVTVKLDNLNSGATQVVLMKFKRASNEDAEAEVKVRLSYSDLNQKRIVEKTDSAPITFAQHKRGGTPEDASVNKNYAIAQLAQGIRDMAAAVEAQRFSEAEALIKSVTENTKANYPNLEDADVKRTFAMAQKYQGVLRERNQAEGRGGFGEHVASGRNIIPNGDFAQGNTGFMSGLTYTPPGPNCLWAMGYTVAPKFSDPLLHRLIANSEYAAPKRSKGTEQVFFANAGGTESLVLWSSVVRCKPNTKYRISFHSISLTPGPEWVPLHEITANGDRSSAQAAGQGAYGEISMIWESGNATNATVTILRLPIPHGGGLIGISNIEMIPIS